MARRLRFVPPGHLMEVTCRTYQGRFLLRPCAVSVRRILGALGRAQRLYQMPIHAFVFLSNHYHLLVSPRDSQHLARFMGYLNSTLAREVGRIHGWRNSLWARRYQAIPVSQEEAAQIERLVYLIAQGSKEGLVASPRQWPGATFLRAVLEGEKLVGIWHDRTAFYRAARSGRQLEAKDWIHEQEIILTPLPAWCHLKAEKYRQRIEELVGEVEQQAKAEARATGRPPLGVEGVLRQDPHFEPRHVDQSPAPLVHAATKESRQVLRSAYRALTVAYRAAAEKLKAGQRDAVFPVGSFPPPLPFAAGP